MKKLLIVLPLLALVAGCNLGSGTDAQNKAQELLDLVKQSCGVVVNVSDLVDVVTNNQYAGATATAKFICDQINSGSQVQSAVGSDCVAVVNGVCIHKG